MTKPYVFVTRAIPEKGLAMVREFCDAEVWPEELPPPRTVILEKAREAEGLLTLLTDPIDAEVIGAGSRLKVISQYAVGVNNIDLDAATARGIPVGHTPGVLTEATADLTWALLMAAARRLAEGVAYVKAGRWKTWGPTLLLGAEVWGATLGIIGFGRIGRAVARRAAGFQMRVLVHTRHPDPAAAAEMGVEFISLDALLRQADFVTLHTPLTEATYHLIGEAELKAMKPTAILINTSRGPVVDSQALYRALKGGEIAYAALDVTDPEPIPADDPLLTLDNCLIVPHIGSATRTAREKMATMAAENLIAGLQGKPLPHCANPEVYQRDRS
ncbi:MAG: D-glycerate dehydrogenase [Chloroflexi bacterium]|nr:MAG: D-glycerate dehydrogenase [Chloroflexota bacterium]